MGTERTSHCLRAGATFLSLLVGTLLMPAPAGADGDQDRLEGQVEVLYRSVSMDGSQNKFDEDFDGLDSGTRLGQLLLDFQRSEEGFFDFARLNLNGLGGEPFEYSSLEIGRKDSYDLKFVHRKQSYLYDLLSVTSDEDGHLWNTDHRRTEIDLSFYPAEGMEFMLGFDEGRRTGRSLFMKDVERDLYQMETPIDREVRNYNIGAKLDAGPFNVRFTQTLRRYDNQLNSTTESSAGFDPTNDDFLDFYEWKQNDDGTAHLTDVQVLGFLGSRVSLAFSYYGTLFGKEEIEDRVTVNASGLTFDGAPFAVVDGFSSTDVDRETDLFDVDLGIDIVASLTLHLQYRSLDQETESTGTQDLAATSFGNVIDSRLDWSEDVTTALLEFRPLDSLTFHGGIRTVDRELSRSGFLDGDGSLEPDDPRNQNFKSDGDDTALFGFSWRPIRQLHFSGDYEDGEVKQPFTDVSLFEAEETRLRATIKPIDEIRINLTFRDFENENHALDYDSQAEGQTWSATFWQRIGERVDYLVGYTRQDVDSAAAIVFDTPGFGPPFDTGSVDDGDSLFDVDSVSWQAQVNFEFSGTWRGYCRFWWTESEGDNVFVGDVSGLISQGRIDQEYLDWEVGLTHEFPSGLFAGGSARLFDYEDVNQALDYDGLIVTASAGFRF